MLSIDYLYINAHPRLPPTRSARGSVTIFTLPQGLRPDSIELTAPPVGGAQTSAHLRLAKFKFSDFLEVPNRQFPFSHRLKDCAHFSEIPGSSASSSGLRERIPGTVWKRASSSSLRRGVIVG